MGDCNIYSAHLMGNNNSLYLLLWQKFRGSLGGPHTGGPHTGGTL